MTLTICCFFPSNTHSPPLEGNCILGGVAKKLGLPVPSAFQQENSILGGISWWSVGLTTGYSADRQSGYGKTQSGAKTTVTSRDSAGPGCTLWGETPEVSPCRGSRLHRESPAKHANPLHKVAVKRQSRYPCLISNHRGKALSLSSRMVPVVGIFTLISFSSFNLIRIALWKPCLWIQHPGPLPGNSCGLSFSSIWVIPSCFIVHLTGVVKNWVF